MQSIAFLFSFDSNSTEKKCYKILHQNEKCKFCNMKLTIKFFNIVMVIIFCIFKNKDIQK